LSIFIKYLCLEFLIWIYLGCWNATVPIIIVQQGSLVELASYEVTLALAAVISMVFFAYRVEKMVRTSALKYACLIISLSGVLRYFLLSVSYSFFCLIAVDMIAVSAFGVVLSLFGVYPAEVVDKCRVGHAFRVRRILTTISRVIGPALAGIIIGVHSTQASLLFAALVGIISLGFALAIPRSGNPIIIKRKSTAENFRDIFLGIKLKLVLPPERFLSVSGFLLNLATAAILPILIPSLILVQNLDKANVGLLNSIFAGGSVAGVFFLSPLITGKLNQRNRYIFLWAVMTLALVAFSYSAGFWQLAPCVFFTGAASACISLIGIDRRTLSVPQGVRIRLTTATLIVNQLANSTSYMVVGAIISNTGIRGLFWLYLTVFFIVCAFSIYSKIVWDFLEDPVDSEFYYQKNHPKLAAIMVN
jgi:ENTS family enterobactin (siderophore) exporter